MLAPPNGETNTETAVPATSKIPVKKPGRWTTFLSWLKRLWNDPLPAWPIAPENAKQISILLGITQAEPVVPPVPEPVVEQLPQTADAVTTPAETIEQQQVPVPTMAVVPLLLPAAALPEPAVQPPLEIPQLPTRQLQQQPQPIRMSKPEVSITKQALYAMRNEVLSYPNIETGWGLYGFRNTQTNAVQIIGILRPNQSIRRSMANIKFGDLKFADQVLWMEAFAAVFHRRNLLPQHMVFEFLFKGHSHHQLGVHHYSFDDMRSLKSAVLKDAMPVAIGPLANIRSTSYGTQIRAAEQGVLRLSRSDDITLRFYYYSLAMAASRYEPVEVTPAIAEAPWYELPQIPDPWFVVQHDYYRFQIDALEAYGCIVDRRFFMQHDLPLKIRLIVIKPGWQGVVSIVTQYDFPNSPPTFSVRYPGGKSTAIDDQQAAFQYNDGFLPVIGKLESLRVL